LGYFGIFATTLRVEPPHFRFEKDFNFYLNSSRAAPKAGISVSLQQTAGEFKFKKLNYCYFLLPEFCTNRRISYARHLRVKPSRLGGIANP
jgi:hypothetical protein